MLSTYYVIFILYIYIVTTYYVVNGINIVKYLHTVNPHNGGNDNYISRPCATGKRGLWVATRYGIWLRGAIYTLLIWVMGLVMR
jgi:hypothetical protein